MDYTKKMEGELDGLRLENYDYFKKMVSYAGYRGYFCDGEALSETLYNMVCDLKEVERDGLTAEEFFGKDPKSMMDQIIAETPRRRIGEYIKLALVIFALTIQMRLSLPFISDGFARFTPLVYLVDLVSFLIYLSVLFGVWGQTVYQKFSKNLALVITVVVYFSVNFIERYIGKNYGNLGSFPMPAWLVLGVIGAIGLVLIIWGYKGLAGRLLTLISLSFVMGVLARIFLAGVLDQMMLSLVPVLGMIAAFAYYFYEKRREG